MATPQHIRTPAPGVMKYIILVDHFLVIVTIYLICLIHVPVQKRRGEEILHFHYMAMPQHKIPCPVGHEIYIVGRPFFRHHCNYILSLSDLCLGVEKKIFKEIMHFHYMNYMATPQHKKPYPRGHEIYNFGRPFLVHHCYTLSLSKPCPGVKKKTF